MLIFHPLYIAIICTTIKNNRKVTKKEPFIFIFTRIYHFSHGQPMFHYFANKEAKAGKRFLISVKTLHKSEISGFL